MQTGIALLLGIMVLSSLSVAAAPRLLTITEASASYRSRDVLSAWTGTTNQVSGTLTFDDQTGLFQEGQIQVQLASIDSKNGVRDGRMRNEFLQTDQYPTATYVIRSLEGFPDFAAWKLWGTKQRGTINGDLTIRNITRPVSFTGEAIYTGRGLTIQATGSIKMTDFMITLPSLLFVTVADTVGLDLTAVAKLSTP